MKRHINKAEKLLSSGFFICGYGHFDITVEELAQILKWVEKNDFKSIKELYLKLEGERL